MAKILLIEDDKLMIKLYVGVFQDEGFEVLTAENGLDGLDLARKEQPDLILLDILMRGLNGISVLDAIKHDNRLKSIPVIMLTNLSTEEMISLLKGASEYLVKAKTDPKDIVEVVKKHLNQLEGDTPVA
jgi:CheY-like chemotaxis protein